jgi:hypothetical protein
VIHVNYVRPWKIEAKATPKINPINNAILRTNTHQNLTEAALQTEKAHSPTA